MKYTVNVLNIDKPSVTGRVYTKKVIEEAVESFNKKDLKVGVLGESGIVPSHDIRLADISHKVSDLRIEENHLKCEIEPYDTPNGVTLKALLEHTKLAVAPRMLVDIQEEKDEEGNVIVDENNQPKTFINSVEIISIDVIPSELKAFTENEIDVEKNMVQD